MKFSILIANYNNGEYIADAIQSVLDQTFTDWELIVVDDCSTDYSLDVIHPFLEDRRIRLIKNSSNRGYIYTLKRLINEAKTEILGILDSDDALYPNALEMIFDAYEKHPDCGFIYSQFECCDSELKRIATGRCNSIPPNKSDLHCDCVSHFKTFNKNDYLKTEGYDEEIIYAEDKDLVYKMEEVTKLFFVNKVLYKYRILPNSQAYHPIKSRIGRASFMLARYNAYMRRLNTHIPNLTKEEIRTYLLEAVRVNIGLGKFKTAMEFLSKAIRVDPLKFWIPMSRDLLWTGTFSKLYSYIMT